MKYFVLSLLLVISTDPRDIAKVNSLKKEAEKAFLSGNYQSAVKSFRALDSLKIEDPALKLNLAHVHFHLNDTAKARSGYQAATTVADKRLKSIAYQQLGVLDRQANKLEDALKNLKASLKADPTNEGARYDYELVKKLLENQQKQDQNNDQNQDQEQNKDKENQENKDDNQSDDQNKDGEKSEEQKEQEKQEKESKEKEGEKKEGENEEGEEQEAKEEQQPTPEEMLKKKLEEMNMTEEKAQMILEALRNNEVQYLQQQKRKATKRPPSGKPDW